MILSLPVSSGSSESVSMENEKINEKDPSVINIDVDINIDGMPETNETTTTEKLPGKFFYLHNIFKICLDISFRWKSNISYKCVVIFFTILACVDNQFTCDNGECIPSDYVEDGDLDCVDGSDESTNTKS